VGDEIDLREYVRLVTRHWVWVVGTTVVAMVVTFVVSSLLPSVYEATALAAATEPRYALEFASDFETLEDVEVPFQAFPELAMSDALLEDLLLALEPQPEGIATIEDLRQVLAAQPGSDPSVVRLTVRWGEPEVAAVIANAWAQLFVVRANQIYGTQGPDEVAFLETQLEQAGTELETAEEALTAFQARNEAAITEARLASAQQDLHDYLTQGREIERLVRNVLALQARVADQAEGEQVGPDDAVTALLLQVQAFSARASRPAHPEREGEFAAEVPDLLSVDVRLVETAQAEPDLVVQLQVGDPALFAGRRTAGELAASLTGLLSTLREWQTEIEEQAVSLEPRILALQGELQQTRMEEYRLATAVTAARDTYMTLTYKLQEAHIRATSAGGGVRLASWASVPESPAGPRRAFNAVLVGVLGLFLSVFGVLIRGWWCGGDR